MERMLMRESDLEIRDPESQILTDEDEILQRTYVGCNRAPLCSSIPYFAFLDLESCSPSVKHQFGQILHDLQKRGLVVITQDDQQGISWHLTTKGVEYVERAKIVGSETVQKHRSARITLIREFIGDQPRTKNTPNSRQCNCESFSPDLLAANVIFLYENLRRLKANGQVI
jgi:hypothetical protein